EPGVEALVDRPPAELFERDDRTEGEQEGDGAEPEKKPHPVAFRELLVARPGPPAAPALDRLAHEADAEEGDAELRERPPGAAGQPAAALEQDEAEDPGEE